LALNSQNQILASDFVSLKARVKAEMNRRCRSGSLTAYAGTAYDYSVVPANGVIVKPEHLNKLVVPINAISPSGYTEKAAGDAVPELATLDAKLAAHEAYPMRGSGSDCASGCSGLCSSGCYNTCSGCGGSCSYDCSGCSGTCSGGCDTTCSGSCSGSCGGACWRDGCTSNCTAACRMDCTGGCKGNCGSICSTNCRTTCVSTSGTS
jgi:hypothetical protein